MIEAGKRYEITREAKATVTRFLATITSVEDRGEFWYVGYKPDDRRHGLWGYLKVWKDKLQKAVNYSFKEV